VIEVAEWNVHNLPERMQRGGCTLCEFEAPPGAPLERGDALADHLEREHLLPRVRPDSGRKQRRRAA
jgi:hypothetical protein